MDLVLRQMAITVKKGTVLPKAHVEMQEKIETFNQSVKLQPQLSNAPALQLAAEAPRSSSALSKSCSETAKINPISVKRPLLLFSPPKFSVSDSLKLFWFVKHDRASKKAKDIRSSEVPVSKHDLSLASDLAIRKDNLLDLNPAADTEPLLKPVSKNDLNLAADLAIKQDNPLDLTPATDIQPLLQPVSEPDLNLAADLSIKQEHLLDLDTATGIQPLLKPVDFAKLGKPKGGVVKTDYVHSAVKNITGWLHSVWSYKRPRKISKSHSHQISADDLYLCNECEQQILSEILRSNNIQIAVRYATPEEQWLNSDKAQHSLQEEAVSCCEDGCSVEDPAAFTKLDRESFSKFLHNVPLKEIKTVSQLSDLCHLAYIIPKMKEDDLLSHHNLTFVTSSLDKKAQALEKEKEANDEISLPVNDFQKAMDDSSLKDALSLSSALACSGSGAPPCCISDESSFLHFKDKSIAGISETHNPYPPIDFKIKEGSSHAPVASNLCNGEHLASLAAGCPLKNCSLDTVPNSKSEACINNCPCEWFCCDDKATRTRYFVIQGSESIGSWQTNLTFDPVQFEDASLNVQVHRGIYEAAKGLYQQLLPDILDYLQKHGKSGRICFIGHSLGGSLATLLFLILQIRGVATLDALLPVITFGSPSILCGGDAMLEKLSIPQSHIQSVVMHRDIVPRSFSCHYPDHVAEVLRRINGVFRQHPCLTYQKLLYAPIGDLYILQPEEGTAPPHPFLPEGSGLYLVRHPMQHQGTQSHPQSAIMAIELQAAVRAFLNSPHPLEILRDPGSYGSNGSISKNHDPRSYAKALDIVLLRELEREMHTNSKKSRQLLWPLFTILSSGQHDGRLDLLESQATRGAVSSTVGVRHHELRQSLSSAARGQHINMITALGANLSRHIQYKRLIASQHVQMGMLFIVSAKVLLVEGFLALFAWI